MYRKYTIILVDGLPPRKTGDNNRLITPTDGGGGSGITDALL